MVIYPDNIWYNGVKVEDVDEIFERSVLNDEVVERLAATEETWDRWRTLREESTKKLKTLV